MTTFIDQRVKVFLESWALRCGQIDETASCERCRGKISDGNFALIDGVLICRKCRGEDDGKPNPP